MSSRDLPQEILRDILERLSVKTLIIFSSVCKSWYSLITDPDFIASHLNQSKLRSNGYLWHMPLSNQQISPVICERTMVERFNLAFPFDCESFNMTLAGSCDGVFCLIDNDSFGETVYLWNPSIRKLRSLPISPDVTPQFFDMRTRVVLGLGFDHVSGDHKIVRLSYFWDNVQKCFGQIPNLIEVYNLNTNTWRRIEAIVSCKALGSSQAFVNGSIHWIARKPKGSNRHLILSFDFRNELFQELMLPATCSEGIRIRSKVLAGFHGSLSLLIHGTPETSGMIHCCYMWVMKQYGVSESWVKQFQFVATEGIYRLPGLTTDGEIIYQNHKMEYFLCDPVDGHHKNTGLCGLRFHLVAFRESLVLLEKHRA